MPSAETAGFVWADNWNDVININKGIKRYLFIFL
jgi:hypothetical protein